MEKRKKYIILSGCIIVILLIVGISIKNSNTKKVAVIPTKKAAVIPAKKVTLSAPNIVKVKDVMKQLSAEKQVSSSQIFIKDNMHYAVITFKKDADIKTAKTFATKYANLIKESYNDKNINVQIVQNGKNITNVVLK